VLLLSTFVGPALIPSRAADFSAEKAVVGKPAPEFTLKDINDKDVKLSDFRKKFVVLEWFNDGCPFVKKHYNSHNMQNLQKEATKKGVVWLSICSSGAGQQGNHTNPEYKEIEKKWDASPTHFLLDTDGTVGHLYGAKTTPDMFVIGKDGELLYAGAIDDKPDTDADSIKTAKNYVREALDQAMAGKSIATSTTRSYGCKVHYGG
jgi:peroxiredoxin